MGVGVSVSSTSSKQDFAANIMQQYSGSCDVECNNDMSNIDLDLIRTKVGGDITLTQACTANASCLISSNTSATADAIFKATNSSSASDPQIISALNPGVQVDISRSSSVQQIQDTISQLTNQNCKVSSTNQMNNIDIFAYDSDIGGSIQLAQQGNVGGQCQLENNMNAAAYATGSVGNCSTSGKLLKKKCSAGKGGKSIGSFIIGFIIVVVVIILLTIIAKVISSQRKKKGTATVASSTTAA
jgi:hypothetical protein